MGALGRHLLVEFAGCDAKKLNDLPFIKHVLLETARRCRATIVDTVFHKFNPNGVSGVVVIAESHISIHTWPEYGYAAVDIFSCGKGLRTRLGMKFLARELGCESPRIKELRRGNLKFIRREAKKSI